MFEGSTKVLTLFRHRCCWGGYSNFLLGITVSYGRSELLFGAAKKGTRILFTTAGAASEYPTTR